MAVSEYTSVRSGYTYYAGAQSFNESGYTQYREHNGLIVAQIMRGYGWTDNAIAGILGNMQSESSCNPGAYYRYSDFSATSFGLVQWDPTKKYQSWADENGYLPYHDIEYQVERIKYEFDVGGQYYPTNSYPESRNQFVSSTKSPYYLACAFAWNYERSGVVLGDDEDKKERLRKQRGGQAEKWYSLITGETPPEPEDPENPEDPPTPEKRKNKMSLPVFLAATRRRFYVVR